MAKPTLVGKFFHTPDNEALGVSRGVRYQGIIKADLGAGFYLIQYFEWLMGQASSQHIFHISDMKTWEFYNNVKDMDEKYKEIEERLKRKK